MIGNSLANVQFQWDSRMYTFTKFNVFWNTRWNYNQLSTFDTGRGIMWRQRILLYSFPCLRFFPSSFIQHLFCISKRNNYQTYWTRLKLLTTGDFHIFLLKNDIFRRKSTDVPRENYYILYNLPPSHDFKLANDLQIS